MNTSTTAGDDKKTRVRERRVEREVKLGLTRVKTAGENVARYVRENPLAAAGIAAGVGFIGGSLFGTRLGRFLIVLGLGHAAQDILDAAFGEGGVRKLVAEELSRVAAAKG
jgi:hypothetical protein